MSNNNRSRRLPNDAALSDNYPADVGTSAFPIMRTADIVRGLIDRSGDPRSMMGPRAGTDGLCSTCQLPPYQPAQKGHEYLPVVDRAPGVSQDVDYGRAHNYDPAVDAPGQTQMDIYGDEELDSGRSAARFTKANSRWMPFEAGQGPFPR